MTSSDDDLRYQQRMANKKRVIDARIANAQDARGVLILMKGNGKGKSSSAFGTLARALGHDQRGAMIQFVKGRRETGEYLFFRDHPRLDFHIMGHGFSWETRDRELEAHAAREAWAKACEYLNDSDIDILVFDELSYMIKYGYLDADEVAAALTRRPHHQHVIITGRTMAVALQDIADTISTVADERHAFRQGVKAQPGIEY